MQSVLLAKYLFEKAEESFSPSDSFSLGLTTSLLQDAAEMLVWEMAKYYNVPSKPNDGFAKLVGIIDDSHGGVDLKRQIFELNQARVGFKHYGNIPAATDVVKHINNCREFMIHNSHKIQIDFNNLSLADTVTQSEVKKHLKDSEQQLKEGNLEKSLTASSLAFKKIEEIAHSSIDLGHWDLSELRDSYTIWPEENESEALNFTSKLTDLLDTITKNVGLSKFGVPIEQVLEIKGMCYSIHINSEGDILSQHKRSEKTTPDEDNIRRINSFIITAAKRI